MTDTEMLNEAIMRSGIKRKTLASKMGISDHALYNKINNKTGFKISEVLVLEDELRLTESETRRIFFGQNVDFKSTLRTR